MCDPALHARLTVHTVNCFLEFVAIGIMQMCANLNPSPDPNHNRHIRTSAFYPEPEFVSVQPDMIAMPYLCLPLTLCL